MRANTPGQLPVIINSNHNAPIKGKSSRFKPQEKSPIITITEPSSTCIPLHSPDIIAMHTITSPSTQYSSFDIDIEHLCNGVQHPITGKVITKYKKLIQIPQMHKVWTTAFGKEFGNQAQGDDKMGERGTNSIFVMLHEEIANIPKGRTVTYGCIVIDYCTQKANPNCVPITAGGNLIKDYPGDLTT